jgi:hypothetical protein
MLRFEVTPFKGEGKGRSAKTSIVKNTPIS